MRGDAPARQKLRSPSAVGGSESWKKLAEKAGATLEAALRRLEANQVRGASADVVVAELAGKNRVTG
jgi:hypothetical protein